MERRQAAAEELEEQGSEGSGRDVSVHHRNGSSESSAALPNAPETSNIKLGQA